MPKKGGNRNRKRLKERQRIRAEMEDDPAITKEEAKSRVRRDRKDLNDLRASVKENERKQAQKRRELDATQNIQRHMRGRLVRGQLSRRPPPPEPQPKAPTFKPEADQFAGKVIDKFGGDRAKIQDFLKTGVKGLFGTGSLQGAFNPQTTTQGETDLERRLAELQGLGGGDGEGLLINHEPTMIGGAGGIASVNLASVQDPAFQQSLFEEQSQQEQADLDAQLQDLPAVGTAPPEPQLAQLQTLPTGEIDRLIAGGEELE